MVRPRTGVHRHGAAADHAAFSRLAAGARARHHARGGGVRGRCAGECRRHYHGAPPAAQPQRHVRRRHPAASLLPAAAQARNAPARAAPGRDRRRRKFFLGTDSAPHARRNKETACGHAGIYSAHAAIELYAEAFEAAGALELVEAFASFHGADFIDCRATRNHHPAARALAGAIFVRPGRRRAGAAARRRAARLALAIAGNPWSPTDCT